MSWFTTGGVAEFLAEAGEFVHAEPARNTVILSVTENLRLTADASHGSGPLFGWWRPETAVTGAFMHTPGYPVVLTAMSGPAAAELADLLAASGRTVPGVNAQAQAAEAFAGTWRQRTGDAVTVHRLMRLHRLGTLAWPDPRPEGRPRAAGPRDRDLLRDWFEAFAVEVDDAATQDHAAAVDERLSYDGITVWEAAGAPASIACLTRAVDGMVRVGPVYTPPALRGRGYAGGATAAVSQAALDAGATQVVLYTDLANPTSNALYERLGYRPVEDRTVLTFAPQHPAPPRGELGCSRERT